MTMTASMFGRDRGTASRAATHAAAQRLAPAQVASLGILLVAAQLPQAVYLPAWIGVLGISLVLLRFALRQYYASPLYIGAVPALPLPGPGGSRIPEQP